MHYQAGKQAGIRAPKPIGTTRNITNGVMTLAYAQLCGAPFRTISAQVLRYRHTLVDVTVGLAESRKQAIKTNLLKLKSAVTTENKDITRHAPVAFYWCDAYVGADANPVHQDGHRSKEETFPSAENRALNNEHESRKFSPNGNEKNCRRSRSRSASRIMASKRPRKTRRGR